MPCDFSSTQDKEFTHVNHLFTKRENVENKYDYTTLKRRNIFFFEPLGQKPWQEKRRFEDRSGYIHLHKNLRTHPHTSFFFFSVYSVMDESLLMLAIDKLQVIYPSVSKSTVLLLLTAIIQKVTLKELQ